MVARFDGKHFKTIGHIRPDTAIGEHDTFWIACGSWSIVDNSQFLGPVFPVTDMLRAEILRVTLTVYRIPVFESIRQFFIAWYQWWEIGEWRDSFQQGHGVFIQVFPCLVADKKQFGFGVVDNIMDIIRFKFMENRNNYGSVSDSSQKSDSPMGTVTSADCYLVSRLNTGTF